MIDLSNGGRGPTVVQRLAYYQSKSHWVPIEREEAKEDFDGGVGSNTTHGTTMGGGGRVQRKSQWERDG